MNRHNIEGYAKGVIVIKALNTYSVKKLHDSKIEQLKLSNKCNDIPNICTILNYLCERPKF